MAVCSISRSTLNRIPVDQVIVLSTGFVNDKTLSEEAITKWARIRRMWSGLIHDNTSRKDCENQLAWAMGYNCIEESK